MAASRSNSLVNKILAGAILACGAWMIIHGARPAGSLSFGDHPFRSDSQRLAAALAAAADGPRGARIDVLEAGFVESLGRRTATVRWRESAGDPGRLLTISGERLRIEALSATFGDDRTDGLSGKTLVLFRSARGDAAGGEEHSFADPARPAPPGYSRSGDLASTETAFFKNLWAIVTDPVQADKENVAVSRTSLETPVLEAGATFLVTHAGRGRFTISVDSPTLPPSDR